MNQQTIYTHNKPNAVCACVCVCERERERERKREKERGERGTVLNEIKGGYISWHFTSR